MHKTWKEAIGAYHFWHGDRKIRVVETLKESRFGGHYMLHGVDKDGVEFWCVDGVSALFEPEVKEMCHGNTREGTLKTYKEISA